MTFNLGPPPSTIKDFTFHWKTWLNNLYTWLKCNVGTDFYTEVAKGNIPGHSLVHKFGSGVLTTTPQAITQTGNYETPTSPTTLEVLSSNVNDTAAGSGAQEVTIMGLGADWKETTVTVELNGTTAVTVSVGLLRVYRWYVSRSGAYSTSTVGPHVGDLTIRVSGAGTTWDLIPSTPIPFGQSVISAYTIPRGKTGYLLTKHISIDSTKTADVYFFRRESADDITTPFSGVRRLIEREVGIAGLFNINFKSPKGGFVGPCDIGFIASVKVGTCDVSAEFELLLVDD